MSSIRYVYQEPSCYCSSIWWVSVWRHHNTLAACFRQNSKKERTLRRKCSSLTEQIIYVKYNHISSSQIETGNFVVFNGVLKRRANFFETNRQLGAQRMSTCMYIFLLPYPEWLAALTKSKRENRLIGTLPIPQPPQSLTRHNGRKKVPNKKLVASKNL